MNFEKLAKTHRGPVFSSELLLLLDVPLTHFIIETWTEI